MNAIIYKNTIFTYKFQKKQNKKKHEAVIDTFSNINEGTREKMD